MKLVRLSETCLVNPDEVASVTLPDRTDLVQVTMRSGKVHQINSDYKQSRWATLDRIVKAIEAAP